MKLLRAPRLPLAVLVATMSLLATSCRADAQRTTPPLTHAAARGDLETVVELLAAGASVDERGAGYHTALMAAASYGHTQVAMILLAYGADPNLRDDQGRTALFRAMDNEHSEVAQVLMKAMSSPATRPADEPGTRPESDRVAPTADSRVTQPVVPTPAPPAQPQGEAPFSRAELLAYLRSIPHSQDGSVPYEVRKEAHDELTRLIKQRGVDFVLSMGTFDREFYEAGASSFSRLAIAENYRAPGAAAPGTSVPANVSFFTGTWAMGAAGMTTRYDRQGSAVVRTDRMVGAAGGFLQIDAGGTYIWQHNRSDPPMRGRWRAATAREMGTEAGSGVVLLAGYNGADWLVTHRPSDVQGEHVTVSNVAQRYLYFIGSR